MRFLVSFSFPQLIRSGNIRLANRLLDHDASVTPTNDAGMDCIAAAEEEFARRRRRQVAEESTSASTMIVSEWTEFIQELKKREALEKARSEARDLARSQANDE